MSEVETSSGRARPEGSAGGPPGTGAGEDADRADEDGAPEGAGRATGRRPLTKRIYRWTKKLHMYAGLLTFTNLVLFGFAGLVATLRPAPEAREPFPADTVRLAWTPPPGATDKQVADSLHALLDPPLAGPVPEWALRRDGGGNLRVSFYSVSGPTHVSVLADEGALRIVEIRNSFPQFLSNLHATTVREWTGDWRLRLWAWMNELGIWALLGLALSGLYLWLASRPRLGMAVGSSLGGAAVFILLWMIIR